MIKSKCTVGVSGPWPSAVCTNRAAANLVNGNPYERTPREEILFQILASLCARTAVSVDDFWGEISHQLEAELRIRANTPQEDIANLRGQR